MQYTECVQKALLFATEKHRGQTRIGGEAYITHPIAVCEILQAQGYGEVYQISALFHDLLEDTDATEEEILHLGGVEVLSVVKILTKTKGYDMGTYVADIQKNPIALAVKCADRLHNLRCVEAADEAFQRKYVLETIKWYLDFSPEIRQVTERLANKLGIAPFEV